MVKRADFVIVGAGIAGASIASELASHGTVVVLERESFRVPLDRSLGCGIHRIYGSAVIHSDQRQCLVLQRRRSQVSPTRPCCTRAR